MSDILIRAEAVTKVFTTRRGIVEALKDFSLEVHRGEVVCLVGASGCGKTTALNLMAGFLAPTTGRIVLEGREIHGIEPRCGMIFQSYALFPWMSVLENVSFGPRLRGVPRAERQARARRWLERTGLAEFQAAYPGELSGGMSQRVALCRALANEPEVLLCDEPFAALDAMTRQVLQEELLRVVQLSGQTVVFITHSIDEALILSDRVVVMSARPGRVRATYDNDLPRPRHLDVQLTERFLELKRQVWSLVEEEVGRALSMAASKAGH
ncbi:MAG: ABC transporter ATP-binding protein [Planctomycetes bacterium]|nr:ABC transporter ATP-binding protein [Planctomycetota bacterium]